jgi:hypothetical protein
MSGSIKAQLANSKWKGILEIGSPVNVSFEFGKDTLAVMNLDQNSVLETMIYKVTNSTFTIVKIAGESDCESSTIGKYKYEIKENTLILTTVEDVCDDRGPVLNNVKLTRNTL